MRTLKKPLRLAHSDRPQDDNVNLVDADGEPIADMCLHDYDVIRAKQIAVAVNCHDALLAACEAAVPYLEFCNRTFCDADGVLPKIRAAISKARPEPASRPDISC